MKSTITLPLLALTSFHAAAHPFAPPQTLASVPAAGDIDWLLTPDLNGDGHADLLCSATGGKVRVFLRNADGSYTSKQEQTYVGAVFYAAAAADFDDDGDIDAAFATPITGGNCNVITTLNDGTGHLQYSQALSTNRPASLKGRLDACDVDRDGDVDLVLNHHKNPGEATNDYLRAGMNDGTGEFVLTTLSNSIYSATAGLTGFDFNRDSFPDFMVGGDNIDSIGFLKGAGSSATLDSTILSAFDTCVELHHAEMDGDAREDLLVLGHQAGGQDRIDWYRNNGTTPFPSDHWAIDAGTIVSIGAGDLDNDGDNDVASSTAGTLRLYANDGTGSFASWPAISGVASGRVHLTDLDRDGDTDIVLRTNNTVSWLKNIQLHGQFSGRLAGEPSQTPAQFQDLVACDFDRDGDDDLIAATTGGQIRYFNNSGSPSLNDSTLLVQLAVGLRDVATGDFNRDGKPDIVYTADINDFVAWAPGNGDGTVGAAATIAPVSDPRGLFVIDYDRDGDDDILTCSRGTDEILWCRNNGGSPVTWTKSVLTSGIPGGYEIWAGQLFAGGNGLTAASPFEIVVQTSEPAPSAKSELYVLKKYTFPAIGFSKTLLHTVNNTSQLGFAVADANKDGLLDIVAGRSPGHITYLNDGTGFSSAYPSLNPALGSFHRLPCTDLDRDGDPDIMFATGASVYVSGWLTTNLVTMDSVWSRINGNLSCVVPFNYNKDAWPDLAVADQASGEVLVVRNDLRHLGLTNYPHGPDLLMAGGDTRDVITVLAYPYKRPGDPATAWDRVRLRFTKVPGAQAMTQAEVNQVLERISVHRDGGVPYDFEPVIEPEFAGYNSVTVTNGYATLEIGSDPATLTSRRIPDVSIFHIVLKLKPGAASAAFPSFFVGHIGDPAQTPSRFVYDPAEPGVAGSGDAPVPVVASPATYQEIKLHVLTGLQSWRKTYFGEWLNEGPGANDNDADRDGMPNIIEYAIGTDPVTGGDDKTFSAALRWLPGSGWMDCKFKEPFPVDIIATLESSLDMGPNSWVPRTTKTGAAAWIGAAQALPGAFGNGQRTYLFNDSGLAGPRRFYRLSVTELSNP